MGLFRNGNSNGREKVFTCNVCNRSFGYKHVLQNHERTHTGEKPTSWTYDQLKIAFEKSVNLQWREVVDTDTEDIDVRQASTLKQLGDDKNEITDLPDLLLPESHEENTSNKPETENGTEITRGHQKITLEPAMRGKDGPPLDGQFFKTGDMIGFMKT